MTRRWILSSVPVLALVVVLGTLTAFAYANSPDPSWVGGLYDDADSDDAAGYITSEASLVDDVSAGDLRPLWTLAVAGRLVLEDAAALFPRPADRPRAPPAS